MYVHKYRTPIDADSIVTLIAEVDKPREIEFIERQICNGDTVVFAGQVYSDKGTYYDTVPHPYGGCDIITALKLDVLDGNDTIRIKDEITVEELPYEYESLVLLDANTQPGIYSDTIALSENTQCTDWLVYEIVVTKTSAVDNAVLHNLVLVPNPVDAGMKVSVESEFAADERDGLTVKIYNSQGALVERVSPTEYPLSISAPSVPGVYVVNIVTSTGDVHQSKLVVK